MFENDPRYIRHKVFWDDWYFHCHKFDREIEAIWSRSDLSDDEKSSLDESALDRFNEQMAKLLLTKPN